MQLLRLRGLLQAAAHLALTEKAHSTELFLILTLHFAPTRIIYHPGSWRNSDTMLPLGLLNAAQGHPMLVELKNGETLNGHLVMCDTWMNLTLKEVVQTSPEGDKFVRLPEVYVKGNNVRRDISHATAKEASRRREDRGTSEADGVASPGAITVDGEAIADGEVEEAEDGGVEGDNEVAMLGLSQEKRFDTRHRRYEMAMGQRLLATSREGNPGVECHDEGNKLVTDPKHKDFMEDAL
ncbi:hypothetical protein G7046_g6637 [Stylonectria norvegica]|nr:hypothetical protein G7046_g6637 [Stylonectria norvegica]